MDKKTFTLVSAMALTSVSAGSAYADHTHSSERATSHVNHQVGGQYYTDYARVTHIEPLFTYVTVREPQRRCETVRPTRQHHRHQHRHNTRSNRHHHRNNSSAVFVGGVIGGAIGHHVTQSVNGNGNLGATIAGAAIGSTLARNAADRTSQQDSRHRPNRVLGPVKQAHNGHGRNHSHHNNHGRGHHRRQHCVTTTVSRQERRRDGYNVTYVYKGETFQAHTDQNPGDRIRVRVQIKPH